MSYIAAELKITGTVQGVGYRFFCLREAKKLNLVGYVKNNSDGSVTAKIEGEQKSIEQLCLILKQGPQLAVVQNVNCSYSTELNNFKSFEITF